MVRYFKIIILILCIMLIFSLTACNSNIEILIFQGESPNWEGTYIQESVEVWDEDENKISYENTSNEKFILKYKGKDIEKVGTFNYDYKSNHTGGSGTNASLNQDSKYLTIGRGGRNTALLREDDIITVTVEWNGNKETFEIQSTK